MVARVEGRNTRRIQAPAAVLAFTVLVLAVVGVGCPCLRGPVNASPALRWWLFSNFGASRMCSEMQKRSVGLPVGILPVPGVAPACPDCKAARYYPFPPFSGVSPCSVTVDDQNQVVTVHIAGSGYAYHPVSKRVGYFCKASVEYRPDFRIYEDDVYVWGVANRIVQGPSCEIVYLENPVAQAANMSPLGWLASGFANQYVSGELLRGYTVVQNWDTESISFAPGILMPPQKPSTPYDVSEDTRYTFANEKIEVASGQRDYLGPFEIVDTGQKLELRYFLQAAGPLDAMVVTKATGELWLDQYIRGQPLGPPPGPVVGGAPLYPGREQVGSYQLPPGQYYVVIDNTAQAGSVAPPGPSLLDPLGTATARLSYVAQLGER